MPGRLPLWATLLIAVMCVPLAWLLYRYVEDPVRKAPVLTRARARVTLAGAAAGSIACLAVATGAFALADNRPLNVHQAAAETVITDSPRGTEYVPENLAPELREARESLPEIYDDGCNRGTGVTDAEGCVYGDPEAPRIVLFGDSHAAHWFPAVEGFATTAGYSVEVHTKSSCPAADIDTLRQGSPYPECPQWREAVIDRINESQPALVLLSSFADAELAPGVVDEPATWDAALGRTLDALDVPTAVIADTPDMLEDPAPCLSANLSAAAACGQPRERALEGTAREAEISATASRGVPLLDFNAYLCDDEWCPPIIGNTLVYRDSHHLTAEISADLADVLGEAVSPLLAAAEQVRPASLNP